jgi:hypothetical protein
MQLSRPIPKIARERTEPPGRARNWLAVTAAAGTPAVLFLLSLYAPPVIRRALGKDDE